MPVLPLALRRDPVELLATLSAEPGAFLLQVPDPEHPATLLGCRPVAELRVGSDGSVSSGGVRSKEPPLAAVERFVTETPAVELPFPLGGGVVGYLAYELGRLIVPRPRPPRPAVPRDTPLAVLRHYDPLVVRDERRGQYHLVASHPERARAAWLERLGAPAPRWDGPLATAPLAARMARSEYLAAARRVLDYLAAGDVYQVNLTLPFEAPLAAPPWALHARLAGRHPAPYGAFLDLGEAQLVANSPELFLRRRDRRVETRPIKGTRPRGSEPAGDLALAAELAGDAKERAEHVMIVDLERNDLGRVCRAGSVVVETLARVESHPTVHHLVSVVSGLVEDGVGLGALLRATFPGGSITGAPKVRAMEIIEELEPWPRGPYTGAIGLWHPHGDLELGLAIRTAVTANGTVRWHAGGGIVADSDPDRELAEAWLKTAALRAALGEFVGGTRERCSSG